MKVLIIGSEGFIGSHCVDFFLKAGNEVWSADVIQSTKRNHIVLDKKNTNFDIIFSTHSFDICINASGSANVAFSFDNPSVDFELNVLNVHKLLVAIRTYNTACKFINFSSAAVYGNPKTLPISENAETNPLSPYGFHKLQSEYLLKEYHNFFGLNTCSLRIFSAYGPRLKKQLFWDTYKKTLSHKTISLYGTGKESRDFIFIFDLIKAVECVIQKAEFKGETLNIASGVETTIEEATAVFFKCLDLEKKILFNGHEKEGDPKNWRADISKIKRLGFSPACSLEFGLEKYSEWLKELK